MIRVCNVDITTPVKHPLSTGSRHKWLDAARVFAMLVIILYHMGAAGWGIWTVCQPLLFFFFLSGYFTSSKAFSYSKWWKRIVALAVPYVLWNTICIPGMADALSWGRIYGFGPDGRYCADYPLWYLRAIILMMSVYPLFRKLPWVPSAVACLFSFRGDNWHCDWLVQLPAPAPTEVFAFYLGCCFNALHAERLRRLLMWCGLPLIVLLVVNLNQAFLPHPLGAYLGIFSFFSLAVWLPYAPRLCAWLAEASRAVFLVFATHAGLIVLLQRGVPQVASHPLVLSLSPILIFTAAYGLLRLMEEYTPRLLPYLAHQGRLPWLYAEKQEQGKAAC